MNCKIVGVFCIIFLRRKTFSTKKAYYFKKKEKIVTLTSYFKHPCPCFHLILNEIPLNKTKNASDVWPRWSCIEVAVIRREQLLSQGLLRGPGRAFLKGPENFRARKGLFCVKFERQNFSFCWYWKLSSGILTRGNTLGGFLAYNYSATW